jgi:ABC-type glycerol-3-phosphate transport system permease component
MVIIALVITLFPLIWIVSLSLRPPDQAFESFLFVFPKSITFQNFPDALDYARDVMKIPFGRMFLNGSIITIFTIILTIIIASFAAFSFSYYRYKLKEVLFVLILLVFMVPQALLLIPIFQILKTLHLLNSYFGIILALTTIQIPLSTMMLRSFFEEVSNEIRDAARIDGASDFNYYLKIVLPMSRAGLATVIIFAFLMTWNDYLFVLVFTTKSVLQTVPVALSQLISGRGIVPWGIYGATVVIAVLPIAIIFFLFQRWFIRGMAMGSLKG